ncbi:hypothetical protein HF086_018009 [Spodoptera exigua]|uniref:Uncharacterized protein n=1 Tax=Spodoptera exigua TaxID=7107 RepID=A0A922M0G2_SPOEX|nr:hypothetical protein HF086_018009 [Spodoptera exigua]
MVLEGTTNFRHMKIGGLICIIASLHNAHIPEIIAMVTKYMVDVLTRVMMPEETIILLKPMMNGCCMNVLFVFKVILLLLVAPWLTCARSEDVVNNTELLGNSSDPNKDMYVIHAMVYQVGIVTNKTDNETANMNSTGNQEAVTFFHTNGSAGLDLSKIPAPLLTNVTAQSMVGVAPVAVNPENATNQLPWSTLDHLANMELVPPPVAADTPLNNFYKNLFKRELGDKPVAVNSGSAVIPQAAGVQSIAIPPLLTLNNNMSDIPVPIPNTSVVHYSKINTLVTKP